MFRNCLSFLFVNLFFALPQKQPFCVCLQGEERGTEGGLNEDECMLSYTETPE